MGTEDLFQLRVAELVKELRAQELLSFKELANRLEAQGVFIGAKALANRVHRGNFSAGFAFAVLSAMGYTTVTMNGPYKRLRATKPPASSSK